MSSRLLFIGQNSVDFLLIKWLAIVVVLEFVVTPFLPKYLKPIYCWQVGQWTILWVEVRVSLQQDIAETSSKVCTVNIEMLLAWHVDFLAFGAVCFDP